MQAAEVTNDGSVRDLAVQALYSYTQYRRIAKLHLLIIIQKCIDHKQTDNDHLERTVADAEALADQGNVASGMSLLHAGWLRAEAARDSGEPWAGDLRDCYNEVMDRYAVRRGLRPSAAVRKSAVEDAVGTGGVTTRQPSVRSFGGRSRQRSRHGRTPVSA
jgi:hypothetical protein